MFERGDDLAALARTIVARGANVVGMAGGDGSQGVVAAVAAEHDLPFVCVPAGTRNHFAHDLGVDGTDVVGALDAFFDGPERRVDLAQVNGRVFVNNASMGAYARIVQSKDYRDAKLRTVIESLPDLVGPKAAPLQHPREHELRLEHREAGADADVRAAAERYVCEAMAVGRG